MGIGSFIGNNVIKLGLSLRGSTSSNAGLIGLNTLTIVGGTPSYRNLSESIYLLNCYCENPVVQAVIDVKALAFSNMRFSVKDLKTDEVTPINQYKDDGGKLKDLLAKPNPLQSTFEWLRQFKVNSEVFGNGYSYASLPVGFEDIFTYEEIRVINNLPPYLVTPVITGHWLEATRKDEIIKCYRLRSANGLDKELHTNKVFHTNNVNIKLDRHFTEGNSKLIALQKPISIVDRALESQNVIIKQRGPHGAWTSDRGDSVLGSLPLNDSEIDNVQEAFKKYGTLEGQYQQIISPQPLKWQKTGFSMKDLMLDSSVANAAIAVCNGYGVPESLVRYYIKTGTLGTDSNVDERRLYDSTVIPESKDFMISLNNFFKTESLGIELLGTFDHLKVLQKNQKEEAEVNNKNQETALDAFKIGAINYNTYLASFGQPENASIGTKTIFDLTDKELQTIGITINTPSDGE
jgi:hypothetical protein